LIFGYKAQSALALCDWDLVAQQSQLIQAGIAQKQAVVDPLTLLFLTDDPEQQLAAAKIWTQTRHSQHPMLPAISQRNRQQKIRIAYYSADFHDHATAYLIAELFELHDKSKFELIGFSFGPDKQDDMRNRLVAAFDQFIDVRQRSDLAVAELSRELAIDIAIDLKGYTQNSRAGIFALRAAPIQVSYLGYPGTMGADFIDYLLADKVLIPESHQTYYAEKIVYLPNSYQVNDGKRQIAERQLTRQEMGLPEDGVVFCCFTNSNKISRDSFVNWLTILASVEGSVLWLIEDNPLASEHLRQLALEHKIDPVRLVFAQRLPLAEHLARHRLADLFLDTLPYNAHTRASDALWAGLPVLTCIGESFAGRVAASLLMAIGLPELITLNQAEYQQLAITLANDRQRLKSIRERLAVNRLSSPLFDSALFVRHIEVAYQLIYQRWLAGLLPAHLQVESHGH
jgi:predicted O-linked N-acetylglucosamine transferase (SPINDLY family)